MTAQEGNCAKSGLVVVVRRSGLNRAEKSDKMFGAAGDSSGLETQTQANCKKKNKINK